MAKHEFTFDSEGGDKATVEVSGNEKWVDPLAAADAAEAKTTEFEIEVVDDVPVKDRNKKPAPPPEEVTDGELEGYSEKVKKRIQHFTRSYHDERRAKEQALREREELERLAGVLIEENKTLKGTVGKNQNTLLSQAKQSAQLELDAAKGEYRKAYEAGDTEKVIAAQEAWTKAQLKIDRVANFRPTPLQDSTPAVKTDTNTQSAQSAPKRAPDARATKWAKDNAWFGSDDEMTAYALGLHNKLAKQGVDLNSDAYYETLDSRMRQVFPENFDEGLDEEEAPPEKAATKPKATVATATRGTTSRKVTLTPTQVQLAKKWGIPLEEYAKSVAALRNN